MIINDRKMGENINALIKNYLFSFSPLFIERASKCASKVSCHLTE